MTIKEAIDELKYSRDMCYFDPSTGETGQPYSEECERMAQALDIAIGALERGTCCDCKNTDKTDDHEIWCIGRGNPAQLVPKDGFCDKWKGKDDNE